MLTHEDIDRIKYHEIGDREIEEGHIWPFIKRYTPDALLLHLVGVLVIYIYENIWGLL